MTQYWVIEGRDVEACSGSRLVTLIRKGINGITGHHEGLVEIFGGIDKDRFCTNTWLAI
jgi:hypothetical protein